VLCIFKYSTYESEILLLENLFILISCKAEIKGAFYYSKNSENFGQKSNGMFLFGLDLFVTTSGGGPF